MKALVASFSLGREVWDRVRSKLLRSGDRPHSISLQLADIPEPSIISPQWVRVRTIMSGISDMDEGLVIWNDPSSFGPYLSFPFVPGNENLGIVTDAGEDVEGIQLGDRVVIDPVLSCRVRGVDPPCPSCLRGDPSSCQSFATGIIGPGMMIGACKDTSGGWADSFLAHMSQVRLIPQDMDSDSAILVPEFTRALRAVLQHPPGSGDRVVIVGGGSLGLMTLMALNLLGHTCSVLLLADNPFVNEIADNLGEATVVVSRGAGTGYEEVAEFVQGNVRYPEVGRISLEGGADLVYETTGLADRMEDALALTGEGRKLVLTGVNQPWGINMRPLWYKDINIRGTFLSGREAYNGDYRETFDIAMDLILEHGIPHQDLITHRFTLSDYPQAFASLMDRAGSKAVKAIFQHVV